MNKKNVIITIISVLILTCIFAFARTTTTDLGLVKPTWDEEIDILADLNANSDILEAFANDPLEFDTGERLEDRVGAMVTGSTQTGITLTYQDSDNTIDAVIGADDIVETMLKFVNLPADEDIFTYESTTGDFEWHTLAELSIQPLDAGLTSIAGLTTAANKSIYTTALDTYAVYDLTAFARTILDDAAATNVRDTLGLTIGTNVQAFDNALTSISGLTYVSPSFIKLTANDTYAVRTLAETLSDIGAQASDASLTSIAGLTYASPSFIKVTAEDTYAIRTITETKTDLSLNNVTNDAQIAKSIGTAQGDLIYFTASATPTVLAKGTATQVLAMNAGATAPEWVAAAGGYTNLTSFVDQTAWRLFYSNNLGDVTELALGTDGQYLKSTGAASAPIFATPSGAGDMLKATYDTDADGDIDVAAGGTEKSAWTLYCIPYLSGTTAFGEIAIGTAGQVLKVAAGATGYEWAAESGGVDTSGTPVDNDFAKFTDADTIEGRSYSETMMDLNPVTSKSGVATLTTAEAGTVLVSAAAAYTLTLPTAVGHSGLCYHFIKTDANYNLITLDGDGTETFNYENSTGTPNLTYLRLNTYCAEVTVVSDGANWQVLDEAMGQVPEARVYLSAEQADIIDAIWIHIAYDAESYDISSNYNMATWVSGNATSTSANHLVDSGGAFTSGMLGCRVKNTTDTTYAYITVVNSSTDVTVNPSIFVDGEGYEIKYSRFVAPISGKYEVYANVQWKEVVADRKYGNRMTINDVNKQLNFFHASKVADINTLLLDIISLSIGDYIRFKVYTDAGVDTCNISAADTLPVIIRLVSKD